MKLNFFDEVGGWDEKWVLKVMKNVAEILGFREGEISVFVIGEERMKELNEKWRKKKGATDVLSFELEDGGEIFICEEVMKKQAKEFWKGENDEQNLCSEMAKLVSHGMVHLKGFDHEKMSEEKDFFSEEEKIMKKLSELNLLNNKCVQKLKD